jgi:glycine/D-amino acid oxidase-like deaminating enzyme
MTSDGMPIVNEVQNNHIYISGTNSGGLVEAPVISLLAAASIDSNLELKHILNAVKPERDLINQH